MKWMCHCDVANPLDFPTKPPTLIPEFANTNSIGESIPLEA